jgi:hypothetical protein
VQVAAPGVAITSTYPTDTDNNGIDDDFDTLIDEPDENEDGLPDGYERVRGTSQASPVVAGIVALLKAANPNATAAQIKEAILNSVDPLASLERPYTLPPFVSTAGRVNAFRAVRYMQERFVGVDEATRGNWHNEYGGVGAYIVGDPNSAFPSFTQAQVSFATEEVLGTSTSTRDTRPLQLIADPAQRISSYFASSSFMEFRFDFTDTDSHRVSFYAADLEKFGRMQSFQVFDVSEPGAPFGIREVVLTDFTNGKYVTFDLSGSVVIKVENRGPVNAIVNGVFFDVAPIAPQALVRTDTTTKGRWMDRYGSQGGFVIGESNVFPSFVNVNVTGGATNIVKQTTKVNGALQKPSNPNKGIIANYSTDDTMTIDIEPLDDSPHYVSTYFLDDQKRSGRIQRVDLFDVLTGDLLATETLSSFTGGTYLTWEVDRHVQIVIRRMAGESAIVNGFFFDSTPASAANFVRTDANSRGNWKGVYGIDGQQIVGDSMSAFPTYVTANVTNGFPFILKSSTSDRRALQKIANTITNDRVVGYYATPHQMIVDLDFNDDSTHRIALYFVDFNNKKRKQRIDLIDSDGNLLSSREVADFRNGKYLVWDVRGRVQLVISRLAGPDAILNGVFFD